MPLSDISSSVSFWYDSEIKDEGTQVFVFSGTITENAYGEKIPGDKSWTGSYMTEALMTEITPTERQFLPEGNRNDEVFNFFFPTGSEAVIGDKILISDLSTEYEIIQETNFPMAAGSNPFHKVQGRLLTP